MNLRSSAVALGAVLLLPLLLSTSPSEAQTERSFRSFRAVTVNGQRIDGGAGTISSTEIRAVDRYHDPIQMSLSELDVLDIQTGTKSAKYGLVGGLCGTLLVGAAIVQIDSDPDRELREDRLLPVTAITVGVGALVGAVIGLQHKNWESVTLHPAVGSWGSGSGGVGLALRF